MKNCLLIAEIFLILFSAIVNFGKIKCFRNCGKCKKDICSKKAELVINPQWIVCFVLGVIAMAIGILLLYHLVAWFMLSIGWILLLITLFFIPFAYRFNHIGIYFLKCLNKNTNVEYDSIENISLEKTGINDGDWNNDSILTQEYVITKINTNQKQSHKKESVFETQKTTAMLKKYCPQKFPKAKVKKKKHLKDKS